MEFLTPKTTDGLGVAAFVESGEEVIDVVRVRPCVVGHRPDQLFNEGGHRDLSRVRNVFGTPKRVIINFHNYLFHALKLTAISGRVKVRGQWSAGGPSVMYSERVKGPDGTLSE